jgi:hypothetical protein
MIDINNDAQIATLFDAAMNGKEFSERGADGLDVVAFANHISEALGGAWAVLDILTTYDRTAGLAGDAQALAFLAHFQLQRAQGFPGVGL